jgi:hypothetical protein
LPKKIPQNIETGEGNLNHNVLVAGFLGGLICGTLVFIISRAMILHKLLRRDKIRDLSFYGRNTKEKIPVKIKA